MADMQTVKKLRDMTGLGFMDCKVALDKSNGDIDAAIDELRKSSSIKAAKKEGRSVHEGVVSVKHAADRAVALCLFCETDFVAKSDAFVQAVDAMLDVLLASVKTTADIEQVKLTQLEPLRQQIVQKAGENIQFGQIEVIEGSAFVDYIHSNKKIGVLMSVSEAKPIARDIAMHIAAEAPLAIDSDSLDQTVVSKERDIIQAQAAQSGKPQNVQDKMVEGRMQKFMAEKTLLNQPFVKDPDVTIKQLLNEHNVQVNKFVRLEVSSSSD